VRPPRLKEALAWLECTLEQAVELGDHIWITGRVVKLEVKDGFWNEAGVLDLAKAKPLCHLTGEIFAEALKEARYPRAR
jgi:flavin reductase (DIM6/NTAB) family NADH-FMN oxidoreductase RutF